MSCKIVLTDTAKSDLRDIAYYIADQSKEKDLAIRFVSELHNKWKVLESFPEIGSLPRDRFLRSSGFRFLVHKDYLIFYLYDDGAQVVQIVSVFHSKRDYMRVMRKFL